MFAFAPADAPDLIVRNEARVGPDPILIEAAPDPAGQRNQVTEVHEHHRFAEGLAMDDENLEGDQRAGRHAEGQRQTVIGRRRAAPDEDRPGPSASKSQQLEYQTSVRNQKSGAQQQKRPGDDVHSHAAILRNLVLDVEGRGCPH